MYIRKIFLNRVMMIVSVMILSVMAALFCFTDTEIPPTVYCLVWTAGLLRITSHAEKACRR